MQLRNLHRQQLTARSVIASTLLGTDPPVLSGRILVRAAALFGITEGAARVALSRMVAAGELTSFELASNSLPSSAWITCRTAC